MPLRPDMEPQEYLNILLRRKWGILFVIIFIIFAACVICVVAPEKFRSSTTILVVPQRVPEGYVKSTVSVKIEERLATIQQQVMSRTRLVAVMDELGLFKELRKKQPIEEVVDEMRKRIQIQVGSSENAKARKRDTESDSFTLSFTHENRQTAMLTASRLASFFIDENLKNREAQAVGTSEFLDSQLQETKAKLEAAEQNVRQYKMRFMGELPQQMQANLAVLTRYQEQLRANADTIRNREDRKVFMESQIASLEAHIRELEVPVAAPTVDDPAPVQAVRGVPYDPAQALVSELAAKKSRLSELTNRYTDKYPEVLRMKSEVEQLEKKIDEVRSAAPAAPAVQPAGASPEKKPRTVAFLPIQPKAVKERDELRNLKAQLVSIDAEIPQLKKERQELLAGIATIEAKVSQSPKREQEMIALSRDYDNMKASYDDLLKKKLDADVSQNLEKRQKGEQFQILDPANLPEEPFTPNRKKILGIAVALALGIAFGGAVILELMDPSLRNSNDFKHFFSYPVLATVPQIQDGEFVHRKKIRKAAIFLTGAVFTVAVSGFLLLYGDKIRILLNISRGN
jgi:polysaccharide chain length determinant protein (PEP-CTERM system associated)